MNHSQRPKLNIRLLQAIVRTAFWHPWLVLLPAIIAAAWGLQLTVTRLGYLSNTNDLIRQDAKFHQHYLNYIKEFRVTDDFIILVEGNDFERNKQVLQRLNKKLTATAAFSKVFYRFDFSSLEKRFLLFLPVEDLQQMEQGLGDFLDLLAEGKNPTLDLNSMLTRANSMFDEKFLRKKESWGVFKPFIRQFVTNLDVLADQLEGKTQQKTGSSASLTQMMGIGGNQNFGELEKLKAEKEYLVFNNGTNVLMLVTPKDKDPEALSPYAASIDLTRKVINEVRTEFPDIKIGLTGEPVLDADQIEGSMKSVSIAGIITLVLIVLLFLFSYREFARPLLAVFTLILATFWTFGFTVLAVGHLNIISNAFVSMILGLGIDFSIQLLGRYEEEISRGLSVLEALQEAVSHTGIAILTGAATTAAAFYTMCFNDFVGLAELGVIAGTGILFCVAGSIIVFPACIALVDRRRKNLVTTASPKHWRGGVFLKQPFAQRPAWMLGLVIAVTFAAGYGITHLRFDYNLLNLQNDELESVKVEKRLLEVGANSTIFAVGTATNLEDARIKAEQIRKLPSVRGVETVTDILPLQQEEKLRIISRIVSRLKKLKLNTDVSDKVDVVRARRELSALLENSRQGLKEAKPWVGMDVRARDAVETFGLLIPALERAVRTFESISQQEAGKRLSVYQVQMFGEIGKALRWLSEQDPTSTIQLSDIPKEIQRRFIGVNQKVLLMIYPKENIWEREPSERFVGELRSIDPQVTGTPVQNFEYLAMLKEAFERAGLYSILAICLVVLIHFRSVKLLLFTLLPLGLAILWTTGLMPAIGLRFNPANIITLPLVIGIGVAYGIYAVDRFKEDPYHSLFDTSTGKSMWLSALTTIFGFGSLIQASYRGIASIGLLMTIGVGMCLITSLYVLPIIFRLMNRPKTSE